MGGYAALYCSNYIDNCICFAVNPQTFPKTNNYPNFIYQGKVDEPPPEHIYDLRKVLSCKPNNSKKYILVSKWECETDPKCVSFHDLLYSGYLLGIRNVIVVILLRAGHNIFGKINMTIFCSLIQEKYDLFMTDINLGKKLLSESL